MKKKLTMRPKKLKPYAVAIAKILTPAVKSMLSDPNIVFTRPSVRGTERLPNKDE